MDMEGKCLVNTKDSQSIQTADYGAVNPLCEEANEKECAAKNIKRIETSFETQVREKSRSCSCVVDIGECDCGKKKKIQLEPWAKHKTVAMVAGLSLFGIWMIIIAVVGQSGNL